MFDCIPASLVRIDWQALATFSAVCAATWVGINQLEIQKRQNNLIENEQKIMLLEKRAECFASLRDAHYSRLQNGRMAQDVWQKFYQMMVDAQLLFPMNLYSDISKAVDDAHLANIAYERALAANARGDTEKREEYWKNYDEIDARLDELMPNLLNEMASAIRIDAWE